MVREEHRPGVTQGLRSEQGGELADVVMLLGAVGAGPQGEACRRDGPGVGGGHGEDRGTSSACHSPLQGWDPEEEEEEGEIPAKTERWRWTQGLGTHR